MYYLTGRSVVQKSNLQSYDPSLKGAVLLWGPSWDESRHESFPMPSVSGCHSCHLPRVHCPIFKVVGSVLLWQSPTLKHPYSCWFDWHHLTFSVQLRAGFKTTAVRTPTALHKAWSTLSGCSSDMNILGWRWGVKISKIKIGNYSKCTF